jgi:transcriptional regulator with XRE-family HTH domain
MKKIKQVDWPKAIKQIQAKGYTQQQIEDKTGVKQGVISKLLTGRYSDIYYSSGAALMRLLRKEK